MPASRSGSCRWSSGPEPPISSHEGCPERLPARCPSVRARAGSQGQRSAYVRSAQGVVVLATANVGAEPVHTEALAGSTEPDAHRPSRSSGDEGCSSRSTPCSVAPLRGSSGSWQVRKGHPPSPASGDGPQTRAARGGRAHPRRPSRQTLDAPGLAALRTGAGNPMIRARATDRRDATAPGRRSSWRARPARRLIARRPSVRETTR